ncbi:MULTISPECIES: LacI family DNA-binding transcriptional regulator [Dictyoglomus]|jgi:LacI family transcriptional regulator|uniref:Transcriptional regulator, LacI family n=1 Tax=Dictyoglomus turgidum (strain DSM 6724 / Z-1310) TaxID=515635 RepID=B8DZS8_DICTD|nr:MULTISPECIES: LacI family DNA-binding transcriptional regulator [Dictyoglomus]ACK42011.1 transcriptional regulator, LacI family [Dictyoglomus turgidum DSM 6724]PNV80905.1 MAG: LacI family transcriptional regulator [Dictyoglomus turgidum]HBU31428.1 LacI family transcriptional regulator [Dictyoglomus sp.]
MTKKKKAPTSWDVARLAGVSRSTVSFVLNNTPGIKISEETRRRVLEAVKALDYKPNAIARSLAKQKTEAIAFFVLDIANPVFPNMARGIEDVARQNGYTLFLCNTDGKTLREVRYMNIMLERRVDGIIAGALSNEEVSKIAQKKNIPLVILEHPRLPEHDVVYADNVKGSYEAVMHFVELGHKRIAHITINPESIIVQERIEGYKKALEDAGIPFDDNLLKIFYDKVDEEKAINELFSLPDPPTAIFTFSDFMAIQVMKILIRRGYRIPEDVSVIGFDDTLANLTIPALTTVSQPFYEMGAKAAEILIERLKNPNMPIQHIKLPTKLVIRESTAKRR